MPIIGIRSASASALAAANPTRMPVNRPGPDVDGDQPELVEPDVGLVADELDGRRQRLGVATAAGRSRTGR